MVFFCCFSFLNFLEGLLPNRLLFPLLIGVVAFSILRFLFITVFIVTEGALRLFLVLQTHRTFPPSLLRRLGKFVQQILRAASLYVKLLLEYLYLGVLYILVGYMVKFLILVLIIHNHTQPGLLLFFKCCLLVFHYFQGFLKGVFMV